MASRYPNAVEYLEQWGLDPAEILEDGVSGSGYWAIVWDPNKDYPTKMFDLNGDVVREWHEWPEGFDGKHFIRLVNQDWQDWDREENTYGK
jgi:hypothetical protein